MQSPAVAFGPYLVYEPLGVGGMASVHRAEQPGIEGFTKTVALKRILPQLSMNSELVKSFVREARLASYMHHENVAQTYDFGKVDGIYFIAMELVVGSGLDVIMKQCIAARMRPPVGIALNLLNQLCDALDYAHNLADESGAPLGIIHRDVNPANILIGEGATLKLIDFGIAKASAMGMETGSVSIKGKFSYIAPEYVATGVIDARADLFGVGIIAYELLTNAPLFTVEDDFDTLDRLKTLAIPPLSQVNPEVPAEIDDVIMTALQRDPAERWGNASAMRNALAVLTKRHGLQVSNAQVAQWLDELRDRAAEAAVAAEPAPSSPTSRARKDTDVEQWTDDTNVENRALRQRSATTPGAPGYAHHPATASRGGAPPGFPLTPMPLFPGTVMRPPRRRSRVGIIGLMIVLAAAVACGVYFLQLNS